MKDSTGSNYMLAGAQDNGTHQFTTAGVNATTEVTGGDGGFCFIDQDDPTYQITSYVRNNWRRSTNGGTSFSNISSESTGRFINPADYDDDADILYAADDADKLYRISGVSGSLTTTAITVGGSALGGVQASHIRCSPYTSNTLFVGNGSGGIFKVTNANGTATSTNIDASGDLPSGYISCIEVGTSENQLLVTFSNYGTSSVWQTLDGGANWVNKEGNLPDMPVRWALYNPNDSNQVMLATEVGVWTTDDISASSVDWDPSNNGLANVRCDMLQIRSSDYHVAVGTHGRGVYTSDVFASDVVKAGFYPNVTELCAGQTTKLNNTSTGNVYSRKWTITPNTFNYMNGTDSSSINPELQFNASGQYNIKLYCQDSLASEIDSLSILNAITINEAFNYKNWMLNFDTMTIAPTMQIDSIWTIQNSTNYLWAIDSNGTATAGTGPAADYSGSGKYLYAEASSPAASGDRTYLESRCIVMPDTGYFKMAYHMYGTDMGDLEIQADTGNGWFSLQKFSGEQHSSDVAPWSTSAINLQIFNNKTARVRVTATRGSSWISDIAIDEMSFYDVPTFCDLIVPASCTPTTVNGSSDDGVYAVRIGATTYTSSGAITDGDYTDRICTDTFSVSDIGFRLFVNAGNSFSNRVRVYIDYNNDGQLDTSSEMVWYSSSLTGYRNDSITIPLSGVVKGTFLRMRIMADDNTVSLNDPCGALDYGESEDFGLKIIESSCSISNFTLGNDRSTCGATLNLDAGDYTAFLWSTGDTSRSTIAASSGSYSVLVTDSNGCTGKDTVEVSLLSVVQVDLGDDTTQCGGSVTLSAGTFSSYVWSTGSTNADITVTSSGTYWVTVTDGAGCSASDTINVILSGVPDAFLGPDKGQCGGTVTLFAGLYNSYSWSSGSVASSILVSTSGKYSVTVTDANGCTGSDSIDIYIYSNPIISLGADTVVCSVGLTLSPGAYLGYVWTTGSAASSIFVTTSGKYGVRVTDANGCTANDEITVTIKSPQNDFLAASQILCEGDILDAGPGSNYIWNTGATTQTVVVNTSSTYVVSKLDANGCAVSDNSVVTVVPIPTANFTYSIYDRTPTTFKTDFTNTSSDQNTVSWDFGNGNVSTANNPTQTFNRGSYQVRLIVVNDCGSDTITKTVAHTLGVENISMAIVNLYPNPTSDILYIQSSGELILDQIQVYDVYGKKVMLIAANNSSAQKQQIDVSDLAVGTYYVEMISGFNKIVKRVVIVR
jgi:hypothetical protein